MKCQQLLYPFLPSRLVSIVTTKTQSITALKVKVEPHIVDILIAAGRMNLPFSVGNGINMINGLIDETRHATCLFVWKCQNGHCYQDSEEKFKIGRGYWNGLMTRYKSLLVTKKGKAFPYQRDLWNKRENLETMHENIYDSMIQAGVAKIKQKPSYQDMNGNDVGLGSGMKLGKIKALVPRIK